MMDAALQQEVEGDQTHISERTFLRVAEQFVKIPNLAESKLLEVIKEACQDKTVKTNSSFLLLHNWNLLVELYRLMPQREFSSTLTRSTKDWKRATAKRDPDDILKLLDFFDRPVGKPVERPEDKPVDRPVERPATLDKSFAKAGENIQLQQHITALATNISKVYDKASEAFKAFDTRKQGFLVFSDFMGGIADMKLAGPNFTKDVILQIFTFLDMDKDNRLKYADFCSLVS